MTHDIIEGPANWRAEEMRRRIDWIQHPPGVVDLLGEPIERKLGSGGDILDA